MRLFSILVLLNLSLAAHSQNIKVCVLLEKDKSPVQFASVGLVQLPDSAMTRGTITLTDGATTISPFVALGDAE